MIYIPCYNTFMPFLIIRAISQGIFLFVVALLSFVGITPEVSIPTNEESREAIEDRKSIVLSLLSDDTVDHKQPTKPDFIIDDSKLPKSIEGKQTKVPEIPQVPVQIKLEETTKKVEEKPQAPVYEEKKEEETTLPSTINNIVVNILCTSRDGNKISASTGSGVIISDNGVILTNAHIAQLFLLKNYKREGYMDCSIRRENIPTFGYKADLLYISKDWVENNAHLIKNPAPQGTGENDYALLAITDSTNPTLSIPKKFPSAKIETLDGSINKKDSITVAGYPGEQINFLDLNNASGLKIDSTFISDIFTFGQLTTDVLSTGETPVAVRGSSGGGVFKNNTLIGIIATVSGGSKYSVINAITTSYINKDIKSESGSSLTSMISGDVKSKADTFTKNDGAVLLNKLIKYL